MAKKTKKWEGKCRNCRVQLKEGFLIRLTKRDKKRERKKKRKTPLLIYSPPKNSTLPFH
jgi:ferredoxin